MKKVLIVASVASMIDQFNIPNIYILQEMGYSVDIACNFLRGSTCSEKKTDELKYKLNQLNVRCFQIDFDRNIKNYVMNLRAFWQVEYLMSRNEYAFVHCHSPIGGVIARLAGKLTQTKVIYTAHGFHFYKGASRKSWLCYYPIEKVCSYFTDVLITINKEDYTLAKKRLKAKKVVYIPGVGIDISKCQKITKTKNILRKELGIPLSSKWLFSVGELNKNKNHESIIRAIVDIPNMYYTIAGKGELYDYLTKLINALKLNNRVKLLGFREDVVDLYNASDIFVFPSIREGLSVALMEAMASAKPVICSQIRGNTDLINQFGGRMFIPDDISSIHNAISSLAGVTNEELNKLGTYNLHKVKSFDSAIIDELMRNVYSNI